MSEVEDLEEDLAKAKAAEEDAAKNPGVVLPEAEEEVANGPGNPPEAAAVLDSEGGGDHNYIATPENDGHPGYTPPDYSEE